VGKGLAMDRKVRTLQLLTIARLKKTQKQMKIITQERGGHLPCRLASSQNTEMQGGDVKHSQQDRGYVRNISQPNSKERWCKSPASHTHKQKNRCEKMVSDNPCHKKSSS